MSMSFAEFKRQLKIGNVLQCDHHRNPCISGQRTITKIQSNAIRYDFTKLNGVTCSGWCHWPKANEISMGEWSATFLDERTGAPVFTYHLPEVADGGARQMSEAASI